MSKMNIRGAEYPLKKIFSDDFAFTIPLYQRSYAWTTEESEELFEDLMRAMNDSSSKGSVDDLPPYFLGSIVLIKGDDPDAQIIDGQQRLTTLTMLLSAIRSKSSPNYVESLTAFICEKGNIITGTPKRYHLSLRTRDAEFFKKYIQDEGGIKELQALQDAQLPESQRNIRDNTLGFIREVQKLSDKQLIDLTQFIVNRCFLIVVSVSSPDLDSAYRIFSVLNSRGLNLSYSDILKAEIISAIPQDKQHIYADKWENIEASLGSEIFEDVFYYLRTISARARLHKGMIEEFHEHVYPRPSQPLLAEAFIDKTLEPYARALNHIVKANYQGLPDHKSLAKEINKMFKWLNNIDHSRWTPPVLFYFVQNWQKLHLVLHFLNDLERLVISFEICRVPPSKRIDRYCELLNAIYENKDLFSNDSPLQLTAKESRETSRKLDGNIYIQHHICKYILLRLDDYTADGSATYELEKITTEHVLPQNPSPGSRWVGVFPTRDIRDRYVHRLGNLVLLSRGKNIAAENFDFELKKQKYFFMNGQSTSFVLTNQLRDYNDWTPEVIEQRQAEIMNKLKRLWRL